MSCCFSVTRLSIVLWDETTQAIFGWTKLMGRHFMLKCYRTQLDTVGETSWMNTSNFALKTWVCCRLHLPLPCSAALVQAWQQWFPATPVYLLTNVSLFPLSLTHLRGRLWGRKRRFGFGRDSRPSSLLWAVTSSDIVEKSFSLDCLCSVPFLWVCGSLPSKRTSSSYGWKVSSSFQLLVCSWVQCVCVWVWVCVSVCVYITQSGLLCAELRLRRTELDTVISQETNLWQFCLWSKPVQKLSTVLLPSLFVLTHFAPNWQNWTSGRTLLCCTWALGFSWRCISLLLGRHRPSVEAFHIFCHALLALFS